jgi:hypothetical protein
MDKKQASNWKIAGEYFFSSYVAGAAIVALWTVAGSFIGFENNILFDFVGLAIGILAGAFYAARSIGKKYIVNARTAIADIATFYYIIIGAVLGFIAESMSWAIPGLLGGQNADATNLIMFFAGVVLYGAAALRFINNDNELKK